MGDELDYMHVTTGKEPIVNPTLLAQFAAAALTGLLSRCLSGTEHTVLTRETMRIARFMHDAYLSDIQGGA